MKSYNYLIFILSFFLFLTACNNKHHLESFEKKNIHKTQAKNIILKPNNVNLEIKTQGDENKSNLYANKEILSEKIISFKDSINGNSITGNTVQSIINKYGLPINWNSTQWINIANLLSQTNENNYSDFLRVLGLAFDKLYSHDCHYAKKYVNNLLIITNIIKNPYRINRILQEVGDIQQWFINQELGRQTKKQIIQRMKNGMGYNKQTYIDCNIDIAESYAMDNNYDKAKDQYNKILKSTSDLSSDQKFALQISRATIFIRKEAPKNIRKEGYYLLKRLSKDSTLSSHNKEIVLQIYCMLLKEIKSGNWSYNK